MARVSGVKTRDFQRELRDANWKLIRGDRQHEIWRHESGRQMRLPAGHDHVDLNVLTDMRKAMDLTRQWDNIHHPPTPATNGVSNMTLEVLPPAPSDTPLPTAVRYPKEWFKKDRFGNPTSDLLKPIEKVVTLSPADPVGEFKQHYEELSLADLKALYGLKWDPEVNHIRTLFGLAPKKPMPRRGPRKQRSQAPGPVRTVVLPTQKPPQTPQELATALVASLQPTQASVGDLTVQVAAPQVTVNINAEALASALVDELFRKLTAMWVAEQKGK